VILALFTKTRRAKSRFRNYGDDADANEDRLGSTTAARDLRRFALRYRQTKNRWIGGELSDRLDQTDEFERASPETNSWLSSDTHFVSVPVPGKRNASGGLGLFLNKR
jgi:hypothetical protein